MNRLKWRLERLLLGALMGTIAWVLERRVLKATRRSAAAREVKAEPDGKSPGGAP